MKLQKEKIPFTQVANDILSNSSISLKAKGMYAYLFSKPDGWDFSSKRIMKESSDGRHAVLEALKELELNGVLSRKKLGNGRMEYYLKHSTQSPKIEPRVDEPESDFRTMGKSHSGKIGPISNKDGESNKDKRVTLAEQGSADEKDIPIIIDLFKEINPSYRKWFANKTQRVSTLNLIRTHGVDQLVKVIAILPRTNKMSYMPTITTPLQLEDKWASLESNLRKKKAAIEEKKIDGQAVDNFSKK